MQKKLFISLIIVSCGVLLSMNTHATCLGDCDNNGKVSSSEVQAAVNQYLGTESVESCNDSNDDGIVGINELQTIVNINLNGGCGGPNLDPIASIDSPLEGDTLAAGISTNFEGSGIDNDGSIASYLWDFGDSTSSPFQNTGHTYGTAGFYTVTLTVTDNYGATDTQSINILVTTAAADTYPKVFISSPSTGSLYAQGQSIAFEGIGYDKDDGYLSGSAMVWTSDIDGQIGTGESMSSDSLSVGNHNITLTATNSNGDSEVYTITVIITAATEYYVLTEHNVSTETPSYVNLMFQVADADGNGVSSLDLDNFNLLEDSAAVSPTEAATRVRKHGDVPYKMYTIIMLDNSLSVGSNLDDVKNAAIEMINTADAVDVSSRDGNTEDQYFIVYSFSDSAVQLVPDFTNDVNTLTTAINSITLGTDATDLYGSVIEGVSKWTDTYSTASIIQGFLVLLTDGSDTQASATLSSALSQIGTKKVMTVGMGDGIDVSALEQLGNAGFYQLDNYTQLSSQFSEIQTDMELYADSFYWVDYLSPQRGDSSHTIALAIENNGNTGDDAEIASTFNSVDFYSVQPGIYVNDSADDQDGIDSATLEVPGGTIALELHTYLSSDSQVPNTPVYTVTSDDGGSVVTITQDQDDASKYTVAAVGTAGDACTITISDTANSFTKTISIDILGETFGNTLGMTFRAIPAGTFTMGSPDSEACRDSSETQHQVTLTQSFFMQTTEVTQGQWESVMGSNPSHFSSCGDDCPVEQVSWNDIQSFIIIMNQRGEGTYRLPTEAEWEYAVRAGTTTALYTGDITACSGSNSNLDQIGWYYNNAGSTIHLAAQKSPNAWGLYDMSGNVWEWCQDWYGNYSTESVTDPTGPASGTTHVIRGGGWNNLVEYCRSASRYYDNPENQHGNLGFRLVRTQD